MRKQGVPNRILHREMQFEQCLCSINEKRQVFFGCEEVTPLYLIWNIVLTANSLISHSLNGEKEGRVTQLLCVLDGQEQGKCLAYAKYLKYVSQTR